MDYIQTKSLLIAVYCAALMFHIMRYRDTSQPGATTFITFNTEHIEFALALVFMLRIVMFRHFVWVSPLYVSAWFINYGTNGSYSRLFTERSLRFLRFILAHLCLGL
mmetsp:Transcript_1513/g.2054  ORF Transcript_1513/g.2054 Transcript_1513/m.2054 type:complete len:107 (-) Transcript_1513:500-820(-)